MDNNEFADYMIRSYGNSAFAYCIGRMQGVKDVIQTFEDNGSTALMNDWEEEFNSDINRWKQISQIIKTKQGDSSKPNWKNVKKELPANGKSVIKYTSEINSSQQRMYVTICESDVLKHSDESVWWIDIPELPVPLKID